LPTRLVHDKRPLRRRSAMNKMEAKLPKPSKINRKLTLSKESVARLTDELAPKAEARCTYFHTGCLPYTC